MSGAFGLPVIESRMIRFDAVYVVETAPTMGIGKHVIVGEFAHFQWRVGPWAAALRQLRADHAAYLAELVAAAERRWLPVPVPTQEDSNDG